MYLIGRFIKKTDADKTLSNHATTGYFVVAALMTVIVVLIHENTTINIQTSLLGDIVGYSYRAPLVILESVFLFLAFSKLNFQSKLINWMAESCLAIFLIHMHPAIKEMGYYSITRQLYSLPILQHALYLAVLILVVFFGSILIDKFRILLSNLLYEFLRSVRKLLPDKLFSADSYIPKSIQKIL